MSSDCISLAVEWFNPLSAAVRLVYMLSVCQGLKHIEVRDCKARYMSGAVNVYVYVSVAGRNTTNEELESMLESDNPAIFTSGVSGNAQWS